MMCKFLIFVLCILEVCLVHSSGKLEDYPLQHSGTDQELHDDPKSKFRNLTIEIPRNVFFPDGYIETPAIQFPSVNDKALKQKSDEFCPPVPRDIDKSQDNESGIPADVDTEKQLSQQKLTVNASKTSDSSEDLSSSESSENLQEYNPLSPPDTPRYDPQAMQPPPIRVPLTRKWIFRDCAIIVDTKGYIYVHRHPYPCWLNVYIPVEKQQITVTPELIITLHGGRYWFHYKHYWVLVH